MAIRRYNANSRIIIRFNKTDVVYADSNFVLHCFVDESLTNFVNKQSHRVAKKFLYEFLQKKITLLVSSLAFNEVWYVYLKWLYQRDHGRNTWTKDTLKENPRVIATYATDLETFQQAILSCPCFRPVGVQGATIDTSFRNMLTFQLSPADAFHLSTCCLEGAQYFVSKDRDFNRIPDDHEDIDLKIITY